MHPGVREASQKAEQEQGRTSKTRCVALEAAGLMAGSDLGQGTKAMVRKSDRRAQHVAETWRGHG